MQGHDGRKRVRAIIALLTSVALVSALAGCMGSSRFGSPRETAPTLSAPVETVTEQPLDLPPANDAATAPASTLAGTDGITVALLLPLGASGNTAAVATALRNAGELAQSEYKGA
ncbi:MAG: hypothetical protein EBS72_16190, partial [Rhizobiales bacterium]|nr:hypothetical protein [Hyphomicrobiales bacterium]